MEYSWTIHRTRMEWSWVVHVSEWIMHGSSLGETWTMMDSVCTMNGYVWNMQAIRYVCFMDCDDSCMDYARTMHALCVDCGWMNATQRSAFFYA